VTTAAAVADRDNDPVVDLDRGYDDEVSSTRPSGAPHPPVEDAA
jgi:hypothetical protein